MSEEEKEKLLKESVQKMKALNDNEDTEEKHCIADGILCEVLEKFVFSELTAAFDKLDKWYS